LLTYREMRVKRRLDRAQARMVPGLLAIAALVVSSLVGGPITGASAAGSPAVHAELSPSAVPGVSPTPSDQPDPGPKTPVPSDHRTGKRPGPDATSPVPSGTGIEGLTPGETKALQDTKGQAQPFVQPAGSYTLSGHVELANAFGPDIALQPGDVNVELWLGDGSQRVPGTWPTDASGNYVITGVAAGSYLIKFVYVGTLSGVNPTLWGLTPYTSAVVNVQGSRAGLDEVIGEGDTLAGTVTDSGDSPVADAHVYASILQYGTDDVFTTYDIVTDAQGHYQLRGAPWGFRWLVQFEKDGYSSQSWPGWSYYYYPGVLDLNAPPFDFPHDVDAILLHPASIFGTVTGHGPAAAAAVSSGHVQAEVEVYDYSSNSWVETGDYYPVAPDGTYRIDGLYPDNYKIRLTDGDTQLITSSMLSVGEDDQDQFDTSFADGGFVSLAPARLLDTRTGLGAPQAGAIPPGGVLPLQVLGEGGVPASGVAAVVLNVTVAGSTGAGYITAYADGTDRPTASNLNFVPGQLVPNLVVVPVGDGGRVDLYNSPGGATQLVADVAGYYLSETPTAPGTFVPLPPARLLDTRTGLGAPQGAIPPGGFVALKVTGQDEIPAASQVSAVVLNVTVAGSTGAGYITAYPDGQDPRPTASNLNFVPGQLVPNLVVVPVNPDNGEVDLYNSPGGATQLVADVAGYYLRGAPPEPGTFVSLAPARLLDTRIGLGAAHSGAIAPDGTLSLQVTGRDGVPASGVSAVVLNVTVAGSTGAGYITAYADGTDRPTASNLNFVPGQLVPNLVVVPVSDDGKVALYNSPGGATQLVADVAGYYLAG
jgi:hypothetical protein